MAPFGYHPVKHTPGRWVHDNRNTILSLVVDNFCVQYSSTEDADFFKNALRSKYPITFDMEATVYIGIKLDWDYVHITVTFSMPNYLRKALHIFQHITRAARSTPPISVPQYNMDRKINMQTLWIQKSTSQTKKPTSFNKFVALSYTMPSLSTTLFSLPSVTFPRISPRRQRTQINRWPSS